MHAPVGVNDLKDVPSLVQDRKNVVGLDDTDREGRVHGSGQPLGQAMTGIVELRGVVILENLRILRRIGDGFSSLRHIRNVRPLPHSAQVRFPIGKARDRRRGGLRRGCLTGSSLADRRHRCEQTARGQHGGPGYDNCDELIPHVELSCISDLLNSGKWRARAPGFAPQPWQPHRFGSRASLRGQTPSGLSRVVPVSTRDAQ